MSNLIKPRRYKQCLEIFFPPSNDELTLRHSTIDTFTSPTPLFHNDIFSLLPYQDKAVQAAIHLSKFHHHDQAIDVLALSVASFLKPYSHTHTIMPIPLSRRRERERGYNQVTEVLRAVRRHTPELYLDTRTLIRTRHTTPQTALTRTARLENMIDAFSVRRPDRVHQQQLIIVDDVTTTGATLEAARAALAPYKPTSITCVAIAH